MIVETKRFYIMKLLILEIKANEASKKNITSL